MGALACKEFIEAHIHSLPHDGKNHTLHGPDAEAGFSIRAIVYAKDKPVGIPHNHGTTWAIYGQACGVTRMEDWKVVVPASSPEDAAKIGCSRKYDVSAGEA